MIAADCRTRITGPTANFTCAPVQSGLPMDGRPPQQPQLQPYLQQQQHQQQQHQQQQQQQQQQPSAANLSRGASAPPPGLVVSVPEAVATGDAGSTTPAKKESQPSARPGPPAASVLTRASSASGQQLPTATTPSSAGASDATSRLCGPNGVRFDCQRGTNNDLHGNRACFQQSCTDVTALHCAAPLCLALHRTVMCCTPQTWPAHACAQHMLPAQPVLRSTLVQVPGCPGRRASCCAPTAGLRT